MTGNTPLSLNGHGQILEDAAKLTLLRAVQERLLPGDEKMPPAHATGVASAVDHYLAEQPELRACVLGALEAIAIIAFRHDPDGHGYANLDGNTQDAILQEVEAAEPDLFDALLVQSYTGYYTDALVHKALGVPSPLQPNGFNDIMQGTFDESQLDRVKATARPWREA